MRKRKLNGIEHVALGNEQIFQAVVVVVHELDAPAGVRTRDHAQSGTARFVGEGAASGVAIEGIFLLGEVRNNKVGIAVVIVVCEIYAHAGIGSAIFIHSGSGGDGYFFKAAIVLVVEKKFGNRIIGDCDVGVAVVVEIGDGDAQAFALQLGEAGLL